MIFYILIGSHGERWGAQLGCCNAQFPGPTGSIHDSRPAHSVTISSISEEPVDNRKIHFVLNQFPGRKGTIHSSISAFSVTGPIVTPDGDVINKPVLNSFGKNY